MKIRIYQLPAEHDRLFCGFNEEKYPRLDEYNVVYETGELHIKAPNIMSLLEDIFRIFNIAKPENFKGHSLSVSDIVSIHDDYDERIFYCDLCGWKELDIEKMGYFRLPVHQMKLGWEQGN